MSQRPTCDMRNRIYGQSHTLENRERLYFQRFDPADHAITVTLPPAADVEPDVNPLNMAAPA